MRAVVVSFAAVLYLSLTAIPANIQPQDQNHQQPNAFRVDTPWSWRVWDDSRNELITALGSNQKDRSTPLVNIYNAASGEKRSIDVAKDFPNARFINVDGLAVGPEGSLLVACEVALDQGPFAGEDLLLYDHRCTLIPHFTAEHYDLGAVAMVEQGGIYLVGTHDGERSSKESYPLAVKYDSRGVVMWKALPRSLYANFEDPVGSGIGDSSRGRSRIAASEKAIGVYLAPAGEMIVLNQAGQIRMRIDVAGRLAEFAQKAGYQRVYVDEDDFSPSGDLWLAGSLAVPAAETSTLQPRRSYVVRLTPQGQLAPAARL